MTSGWVSLDLRAKRNGCPCVEIESISTPKGELLAPDFALIRVDRVEHRKPLMISQVSLEVGEVVEMVALTPDRFDGRTS